MRVRVGSFRTTTAEKKAVLAVLKSNQLSPGPRVKEFEQAFAVYHKASYGLFVNSGTDALRIALAALKEQENWADGDGVLVPATTFVATVNVVLQNNLTPVFMDSGLGGFNLDRIDHFDNCTSGTFLDHPKVRAIIPVHLCGQRTDLSRLKKYKLKIIEDSCETMGVGPIQGDVACYSTYVCHLMTTGVGGLAITRDRKLADLMRSYANHGRDLNGKNDWTKRFKFDRVGYSCRPTEIEAAIGIEQLKQLPQTIRRRRDIAQQYIESLERRWWTRLDLPIRVEADHAYMMFPIVTKEGTNRDKLCAYLEKNGIETRPLLPLINQPCYKSLNLKIDDFPESKRLIERGFYIGCHPHITDRDVQYVLRVFHEYLAN